MLTVADIVRFLEGFAPLSLAESWDNVGLLVGRREQPVSRVMTCLTVTAESAREAVERGAQLIVTHHPFPFRPVARLTDDTNDGNLLLDLVSAGIAVYSPHTAFDSAIQGINQRLAEGLQLGTINPLITIGEGPLGSGRAGKPAG